MRVMIVHPYWHYGEVAFDLPLRLLSRGIEVSVAVWAGGMKSAPKEMPGLEIIGLDGANLCPVGGATFPAVMGISKAIREVDPDVVDCQSHLFLTSLQAIASCRALCIPSLLTVNGFRIERGFALNALQSAYINTFSRSAFVLSDAVRCLNQSDKIEALRHGCSRRKIVVIPNGVDAGFFKPGSKDYRMVAWAGRFVGEKGLPTLVRAAKIVLGEVRDAKFVLVGDGPLRNQIERMVHDMGISGSFTFTGDLPRSGVASILASSSVFAIPSLREGMPFSLLEAMSSGNAIVGSDIPGIRSILRDGVTGLLSPPGDFLAMAGNIIRLLQEPDEAARIGRNASSEAREKYSVDSTVDALVGLYRRMSSEN